MTRISSGAARRAWLVALLAVTACAACTDRTDDAVAPPTDPAPFTVGGLHYDAGRFTEWKLPEALREVSGFTTDTTGRLFGHDDERAVIHQIDYVRGGIVKSFALGNPPLEGDFEGIAVVDGEFWLATSDGMLYLAPEGGPDERMRYRTVDTGLGRQCEIEGIEYDAGERLLWIACKTPRAPELKQTVTVFAWSVEDSTVDPVRSVQLDSAQFREALGKGPVRPSGIALSPLTGDLVLVAARQRALITVAKDGRRTRAIRLPQADGLPQIEAIAFGGAGELIVGSEGRQNRGRMRVYRVTD